VRSVHTPREGCVSLLSLIPRLIERSLHGCVVVVGVAGWNTSAAGFEHVPVVGGRVGLARCWVLRGHLCCGCVLGAAPVAGRLTHLSCWWRVGVVVSVVVGCGCVLSVA
jgi:hypothetical protein